MGRGERGASDARGRVGVALHADALPGVDREDTAAGENPLDGLALGGERRERHDRDGQLPAVYVEGAKVGGKAAEEVFAGAHGGSLRCRVVETGTRPASPCHTAG